MIAVFKMKYHIEMELVVGVA